MNLAVRRAVGGQDGSLLGAKGKHGFLVESPTEPVTDSIALLGRNYFFSTKNLSY